MTRRFTVQAKGREVECLEVDRRMYANNKGFSSGLAKGLPHGDNYYLRHHKDKRQDDMFLFLRHDEAVVIIELLAGSLWSRDILTRFERKRCSKK
jgi:hypothetical protein